MARIDVSLSAKITPDRQIPSERVNSPANGSRLFIEPFQKSV
ncbi:hypothetical protein [Francisella philomiragia]